MKKDEIIIFLEAQITEMSALLSDAKIQIAQLAGQVTELTSRMTSMEGVMNKKDKDLSKQKNINKGLSKLLENKSEKMQAVLSAEELDTLEKARAIQRKKRKNNGAKRNMHPEMCIERLQKAIFDEVKNPLLGIGV